MKVIVVGAGRVGRKVIEQLSPRFDVVVVDIDPSIVDYLNYTYDVIAIRGDGTHPETLRRAGVKDADYLVATTSNDQANIIICGAAKVFGNPFTIARVRMLEYVRVWGKSGKAFGVDLMISSIPLVAKSIAGIIEYPEVKILRNLYGRLYVAEVIREPSTSNLWYAGVNGRIIVIGSLSEISREYFHMRPREIVLLGASSTSTLIARFLEDRGYKPILIELDRSRAERIAEELKKTTVINHDALDIEFWRREKLDKADVVVSSLESDEKTLFAALLAKHVGVKRVFAIVHEGDYLPLFEENGIRPISPETVTAERIILSIMSKNVEGIVSVIPGAEVVLLKVEEESSLRGKYVREIPVIVGPIIRNNEILLPTSDTKIMANDKVTLIIPKEKLGVIRI